MEANADRHIPDFSEVRREAGEILSRDGNRLCLIEAVIVLLMPLLLDCGMYSILFGGWFPLLVGEGSFAVWLGYLGYWAAVLLIGLFLSLPLAVGLLRMACRMERGETVSLADLFQPFSSAKEYGVALSLSFRLFLRLLLLIASVDLTMTVFGVLSQGHLLPMLICALLVVSEILLWIAWTASRFPTAALVFSCGMPVREARARCRRQAKPFRRGSLRWMLCFLPWILLSALTVFVLFLADVLPRMMISYFRYCRKLNECNE